MFMFLFHKQLLPELFHNLFIQNSDVHNYNTRIKSHIRVKYGRTNFSHTVLIYKGPILWNRLPHEIRESVSLNSFKHKLKHFLLTNIIE